ncbi:hypothetical protein F5Y09DRAFT_329777 [Xylaria sp. FL1042]|nr:hypothetical protein F5Y09DRAFT_329777 [Xylaria sp. FL1042]
MAEINVSQGHSATRREGYAKIVETCRQARADNIEFAWIDTCCIDKSSSSELSEAINSMYRWYQQAEVCYVFLSDLDMSFAPFEPVFPGSKWFTRGWCVQELIAPPRAQADLTDLISKITGINKEVLKISWAAQRETTREEDKAYCLFGILNIFMPILYGEASKAFMRLQGEIIKVSNDLSIFAFSCGSLKGGIAPDIQPSSPQPYCDLLATSPKDFLSWSPFSASFKWTFGMGCIVCP